MPGKCVNRADSFCYVCGKVTFASQKRALTQIVKKAYHLYFGCKVGDQDKSWAPHICCNSCSANLCGWLNHKKRSMPFAVSMVWREPTNHVTDCYFCMVPPLQHGTSKKKKCTLSSGVVGRGRGGTPSPHFFPGRGRVPPLFCSNPCKNRIIISSF